MRRAVVALTLVTITIFGYYGVTLAVALTNQSYGSSAAARVAEWGRSHGIGGFVTWAETEWYKLNPPKKGGVPPKGSFGTGPTRVSIPATGHLPAPVDIQTPAAHALPGEGVWHIAGRRAANGVPGLYEAFVRPNAVNTSFVVGVAWMDPTVLRAQLYSGSYIPGGGPYTYSAPIKPAATTTLVAAFNAGFRLQDANGGYYTQGKMIKPLRVGAASIVIFKDGTMTVGQWGSDVKMSNQVESVRQNLDLIVQNGKAAPGLAAQNSNKWGITLGGTFNVWRSGMGVTKDGALVYVGGPALSISDLANVLVRAGAVRAMQLDINTGWAQYSIFNGAIGTPLNGNNAVTLLNGMESPSRYFANWWNRDFFTMSLRPNELTKTGSSSSSVTSTTAKG